MSQIVEREAGEPQKETVFKQIIDGLTDVNTDLDTVSFASIRLSISFMFQLEKRKKVFNFIASETKQIVAASMKQMIPSLENLERRHYEQKIAYLDKEIAKVQESGENITMDQIMQRVGLSPRFKDRTDKYNFIKGGEEAAQGGKPFEAQSSFKNNKKSLNTLASPPMSPKSFNRSDSRDPSEIAQQNAENHRKLLKKLQEDKQMRKKREEQRRLQALEKYEKDA